MIQKTPSATSTVRATTAAPTSRLALAARETALIGLGTVALALIGQISLPLPFTPVPVTLGSLAALGVGAVLGSRRGIASSLLLAALAAVGAPEGQVTTGATLVLVACGLALLTLTARPLWGWRLGLIVLMGAIAVAGVLVAPVRAFFLLEWPAPTTWLVIAVMTGVVVALMHLVASFGPRLAGSGPGAGRPRADR